MPVQVPNRKVGVYGLAGAAMTVLFAVLQQAFDFTVDADTAVACATIVGFVMAYFIKEPT
jgi:putative flippase GtrA